ncbi:phosphate acetyltransferase [Sediminimonas sp.]|jgi:acyl dehydratase|uniref:phosphate acetyltransferase n=1 Tax=Sediminimonas sp. TaxID=2823379 RepID=UPI0025DFFD42|nr:phosphate acetyltransferase [Sediminimonas sp.]
MLSRGATVTTARAFSAGDLRAFAGLSGAPAGAHVPEPLIAGMVSYLLGVHLPGPGTNYLKQDLRFEAPAPLDTEITAAVEVTRLRPEKQLVDLWARCTLPDGTLLCEGRALVKAPAELFHGARA